MKYLRNLLFVLLFIFLVGGLYQSFTYHKNLSKKNLRNLYENDYLKINILPDWKLVEEKNGAKIILTKNNYILVIDLRTQQASGVKGGRFAEIAQGFPSADAVMKIYPAEPCGFQKTGPVVNIKPVFNNLKRIDIYTNSNFINEICHGPKSNDSVWYFSYWTNGIGYFNYYFDYGINLVSNNGAPFGFSIIFAYNSGDVNNLPSQDSFELTAMLQEMTDMVKSLEIKVK